MSFSIMLPKEKMDYSATSTAIKPLGTVRTIPYLLYQPALRMFLLSFWRNNYDSAEDFTPRVMCCLSDTSSSKGVSGHETDFFKTMTHRNLDAKSQVNIVVSCLLWHVHVLTLHYRHFPTKAKRKKQILFWECERHGGDILFFWDLRVLRVSAST